MGHLWRIFITVATSKDAMRSAWRVNMLNLAMGHRTVVSDLATFVVNPIITAIYDANFMYDISASSDAQIDALLSQARSEYAHARMLTFRLTPWSPPSLEARLALIGIEQTRTLCLLLEGDLRGSHQTQDLRPIETDDDWQSFRELKRAEWTEHVSPAEAGRGWEVPDGLAAAARLKCPPVRYTMAYVEGRPVGFFNSWAGVDGMGQVEDLFVLPDHRHRGIATALIHHCVDEARQQGVGPIVICANVADTPKAMYAAMGWQPIGVFRQYGVSP